MSDLPDSSYRVVIAGGLGNQLFQLANALSASNQERIILDPSFASGRGSRSGFPELKDFLLPENVEFAERSRVSWMNQRLFNAALRFSAEPQWTQSSASRIKHMYFESLARLNKSKLNISIGVGGESARVVEVERNVMTQIGYFQNYKSLENNDVFSNLMQLKPTAMTNDSLLRVQQSQDEQPLVVHVRAGDYANDKNIGVLPPNYYLKAISQAWKSGEYKSIWLFTDSPTWAIGCLPPELRGKVREMEVPGRPIVETFEIMRNGRGYVIANSTLSWWAAAISYHQDSNQVFAPEKWFMGMPDPTSLIPNTWTKIESFRRLEGAANTIGNN